MKILPKPQKSENISGNFSISDNSKIFCHSSVFVPQAERLADLVYESTGNFLQFTDTLEEAQIIFSLDENCHSEGYMLMISQGVATVICSTAIGCFYAVETLRQVFNLDDKHQQITCANCYIEDYPRFTHRGLMVDISRHFFGVDTLKRIVELMSRLKLNKLHLRLSDDQGFRIQIDKYPLLNQISSNRSGSEIIKDGQTVVDDTPCGGYLTKDDARTLVEYATKLGVEIIPEISVPGRIAAVLAAHPEYSCTGQVSEVKKTWGASKDILCAGNDAAYDFVKDILDEICDIFPSQLIHLGADKSPKDRWCNCKHCRERMAQLKIDDYDELQTHLVEQFRVYLSAKGKTVVCYNDGLTKRANSDIVAQVWTSHKHSVAKQIKCKRRVIISNRKHLELSVDKVSIGKILHLRPFKGIKKRNRDLVLGVEGAVFTQYIDTDDKLFVQLLPRLDAVAEVAWANGKKGFFKRVNRSLALYDKLNIAYDAKLLGRIGNTNK